MPFRKDAKSHYLLMRYRNLLRSCLSPRLQVLKLCYTSESMCLWMKDMDCNGAPFPWNLERRAILRAELNARIAKHYGLPCKELDYILDSAPFFGDDCST